MSLCLAIGETRIGGLPVSLAAVNLRSCFVLLLHDRSDRIAGVIHLRLPASSSLAHYVQVSVQRLLADMHGAGAPRGRIAAHIVAGHGTASSLLRTIAGTIRAQGVQSVQPHRLDRGAREICILPRAGGVSVEVITRPEAIPDTRSIALDLGSHILDLHSLRQDVDTARSALPVSRLLTQIVEAASHMLQSAQCFVALQEGDDVVVRATSHATGDAAERIGSGHADALATWLFARGRVARAPSDRGDGPPVDPSSPISVMSQPLYAQADRIGVLYAIRPSENTFSRDDVGILALLAQQASIAISNARIFQRLYAKTSEMEAILQSINDGLVVVDPQMRLVIANDAARRLLHLPSSVQAGTLLPRESPITGLVQSAEIKGSTIREIVLENPPCEAAICQATISQVVDSLGRIQGIVAVLRDVTQGRQLEQLRSNLMSVVSHELKTPLHSISGFVDLILMGKTGKISDLQRDFLTTVKQQSVQLQHIIDDVLEFSRLEYGQAKLTTEPVHLHELVSRVLRKLALLADESQIKMGSNVPSSLPIIPGDSVRLEQVVSNLVDNALKFTPSGGEITVGADDAEDAITLWVSDSGIGIPAEEQARIFHKFYQVTDGINTPGPRRGAGLGLTICKHIVEQHQGDIWVESLPGHGSTFYVALPKERHGEESELLPTTESPAALGDAMVPVPRILQIPSLGRERIDAPELAARASVATPSE